MFLYCFLLCIPFLHFTTCYFLLFNILFFLPSLQPFFTFDITFSFTSFLPSSFFSCLLLCLFQSPKFHVTDVLFCRKCCCISFFLFFFNCLLDFFSLTQFGTIYPHVWSYQIFLTVSNVVFKRTFFQETEKQRARHF